MLMGGETNVRIEKPVLGPLQAINPKWTGLGSNPGMCSEKQVINHLSCGVAPAVCGKVQEYSLLRCDAVYLSVWLSTFERNQLPLVEVRVQAVMYLQRPRYEI